MAESVYATDLKSVGEILAGSIPAAPTFTRTYSLTGESLRLLIG